MKKYFLISLIALIAFSCSTEEEFPNENQDALKTEVTAKSVQPVTLIKSWSSQGGYRGYVSYTKKFTVEVANLAFDKKVSAYHEKVDGSWEEIPLSYSLSIDNQKELWIGEHTHGGFGASPIYADEFVIKYEVNGETYWDNNNGQNYLMEDNGYLLAKTGLYVSVDEDFVSLFYDSYNNVNRFNVVVDVKNVAPQKEVGVVYTTDGWQTQQYLPLSFIRYWRNGYSFYVESPNDYEVERWIGNVNLDTADNTVEYAVVYRVNGQEYWDNNYGNNYIITKSN